jgi:ribokinase
MRRVLVIGNATVDVILSVAHLPAPGETVLADTEFRCAGGKGLNQAVAAARLGVATTLVAPIGEDPDGRFLREALRPEPVETGWLASPHPTDMSIISIAAGGENAIVSTAASARWFSAQAAVAAASSLGAGDILILQGNLTEATTRAALRTARAREATAILNTAPIAWDQRRIAAEADIVVANAGEAETLTGFVDEAAALSLIEAGANAAIVTRGANDALLADRASLVHLPIATVDVVDTSGAGDVAVGTLAGALAMGRTLREALALALAAASLSVTRRGTTPSFPTAEELRRLVARAQSRMISDGITK